MFWADRVIEKIKTQYKDKIEAKQPIIIRDEKTASGRVHVGSLRGVAIHGVISELLNEEGIANTYFYEINDFDPMDGLPVYLDRETFLPHMGKPLCDVPSPDGKAKNFAEYFAQEFTEVISELGFKPQYYRSSELYRSGKFDPFITLALTNAHQIREIYKRVSGSQKEDQWLPLNVICENCGKVGTTRATDFDGQSVAYTCGNYVEWAPGCGHSGRVSPFGGRAKLPWKVEWAAKFSIMNVDVEGGGKDHSTRGGSREIADAISREVFKRQPPLNVPYEFFLVEGKKMSSSKGAGSSSREVADLLPPELLRFLLIQKEPQKVIDFIPDGDTIPVLFDTYDTFAENYFSGNTDDFAKVFRFAHFPEDRASITKTVMPRFSQVAYLVQMPHVDIVKEIEKISGTRLTDDDKRVLDRRCAYAKKWLELYAPEDYKFEIQQRIPDAVLSFTTEQKQALQKIAEVIAQNAELDGQILHTKLHEIKTELGISPADFFGALYFSILGKKSGPKAGWFLSVLPKDFLIERLQAVSR